MNIMLELDIVYRFTFAHLKEIDKFYCVDY